MPAPPSTSAQAARERVARRLRELRADAGITGTDLASQCGWTHSKVSRIENARTPPTPGDIRLWCVACGVEDRALDIVAQSRAAESLYADWRRRVRAGLRQLQDSYLDLYRATTHFRVYSPTLIPGLLQTEGYARALLGANARLLDIPDDSEQAAAARMRRSQIINDGGRRFVLLIEEAALGYQLGDQDAMAAQLGYLLTAGALPAVSLGVIPTSTPARAVWPQEVFHIYDDTLVSVELLSARVRMTEPSEVALYLAAFEQLRGMAVYGATARSLIVKAIDRL